jgi:hypothetical protein
MAPFKCVLLCMRGRTRSARSQFRLFSASAPRHASHLGTSSLQACLLSQGWPSSFELLDFRVLHSASWPLQILPRVCASPVRLLTPRPRAQHRNRLHSVHGHQPRSDPQPKDERTPILKRHRVSALAPSATCGSCHGPLHSPGWAPLLCNLRWSARRATPRYMKRAAVHSVVIVGNSLSLVVNCLVPIMI